MKKVKAEVEKVQTELSSVNKVNKRCQGENEQLRAQLGALQQASTQLAAGNLEIENLRSEVSELTSALKSARLSDKNAQRELADKTIELTNVSLRAEEQSEVIKTLRREKDELTAEVGTLRVTLHAEVLKYNETAEQNKVHVERVAELEGALSDVTEEHERLAALMNTSDDGLKHELLAMEDECSDLRAVNKRHSRDLERVKRQLDKAQEQRLVLEHDLAVSLHEQKQREEELLSLQNFIHAKGTLLWVFSLRLLRDSCIVTYRSGQDRRRRRRHEDGRRDALHQSGGSQQAGHRSQHVRPRGVS
jgi:chromosome segregation ATPase